MRLAGAQKNVTVNAGLRRLDALVELSVVSASISTKPGSPAEGAVAIVPLGKTGACLSPQLSTSRSHQAATFIPNRNLQSLQVVFSAFAGPSISRRGVAVIREALNAASVLDVVLSDRCANSSDTIKLRRCVVQLLCGAWIRRCMGG